MQLWATFYWDSSFIFFFFQNRSEFQTNVDLTDDDLDDLDEQDEALLREIEELQVVMIAYTE